jgi:hypothetical protein
MTAMGYPNETMCGKGTEPDTTLSPAAARGRWYCIYIVTMPGLLYSDHTKP